MPDLELTISKKRVSAMQRILYILALMSFTAYAEDLVEVQLPTDGWYQIQQNYVTLCETGQLTPCLLAPGIYTRINHSKGHRDKSYEVVALNESKQTVHTHVYHSELVRAVEMYCPGSDPAAIAITCAAYVSDDILNRTLVPTNGYVSAPAYLSTDNRSDYDAACIPAEPAYVTATMVCATMPNYERVVF